MSSLNQLIRAAWELTVVPTSAPARLVLFVSLDYVDEGCYSPGESLHYWKAFKMCDKTLFLSLCQVTAHFSTYL